MIKVWNPTLTDKESKDLAYWERNMLALYYADGWYYDDVPINWAPGSHEEAARHNFILAGTMPRFQGWRRVLSLEDGKMTFHIPDDFDVGTTPQIEPNWDGHTTEDKWRGVQIACGIKS